MLQSQYDKKLAAQRIKAVFSNREKSGIIPAHAARLKVILQVLNAANDPKRLNLPGFGFRSLKGDRKGYYAVTVRANWRVIFKFEKEEAILVDYVDYH